MKKVILTIVISVTLLLVSCSSKQSLQEYYIDNTENPNFLFFDVPASIFNMDKVDLTETQKSALVSLKKLNVLAFKKTAQNSGEYQVEKTKVNTILSTEDYTELMKMNTDFGRATISYKGEDDAIDEVIIFGDNQEKGFALIRVLGNDMNPANFVQLMNAVQKSNFDGEGFEKLGELFKG